MSPCEHLGVHLPLEATGISLLVSVLRETFSLGREFGWILLSLILLPHSLGVAPWTWTVEREAWYKRVGRAPIPGPTGGWCPAPSAWVVCDLMLFSGEWLCSEIVPLPRNPLGIDSDSSCCSLPTLSADPRNPGFL